MTINDVNAKRSTVRTALECVVDGDSLAQAARQVDKSKRTIVNWSNAGLLTKGKKWTLVRKEENAIQEAQDRQEEYDVIIEKRKDFQEEVVRRLREAISNLTRQIRDGKVDMDVSDLETLEKLERRFGNRTEEVQAIINAYARKWFKAMREVLDHQKFEELVAEKKRLEKEALEEINPDAAAEMVENTNPDFENYDQDN